MPRPPQDDSLEPILPKHPPVARDDTPLTEPAVAVSEEPPAPRPRPSWDRLVLVGCAVVATLALIVCAIRLNSIAEDERLQACQVRVFAEEQLRSNQPSSSRFSADRYQEMLAECIGIETDGTDTDTGD
jgi:hypothetical protein